MSQLLVKLTCLYNCFFTAFPTILSNNQNEINETLNVVNAGDTMFRVNVSECVNPEPDIIWLLKVS